jgi:hypothetical protein
MAEGEFDMKEHDERIAERLEKLGDLLRSRPSIVAGAMRTMARGPRLKPARHVAFGPSLARSGLGLAACLAVGVCLWLALAGPVNITLADVQRSIDTKPWVLVRYDDGSQEWANLVQRLSFYTHADADGRNFYAGMRDHQHGLSRYYHSNWGPQIHEKTFTSRPYPQTPWEYATGGWDDWGLGPLARTTVEKFSDTIDGRAVLRFDTYDLGPAGLRALAQQVWADPETRLALRIRKYRGPDRGNKAVTGDFSFPESGPASIQDLGAPERLPVVTNWGVMDLAAKAIVDAAREALKQFPRNVCVIRKSAYELSISYRLGDRFRQETYGTASPDHRSLLALELPDGLENVRAWAVSHLTLFRLCLYDGQFEYSYDTGEGKWRSSTDPGATVSVRRHADDWIDAPLMPTGDQWPFLSNVGPMQVVKDVPDTLAGCVLLRYEAPDLRRDWYLDPARDYICLKQAGFYLEAGQMGERKSEQAARMDLTQLPSGQWYARTVVRPGIMSGTAQLDVRLLSEAEIRELGRENEPTGFFRGAKLLQEAKDRGANVTFWAR